MSSINGKSLNVMNKEAKNKSIVEVLILVSWYFWSYRRPFGLKRTNVKIFFLTKINQCLPVSVGYKKERKEIKLLKMKGQIWSPTEIISVCLDWQFNKLGIKFLCRLIHFNEGKKTLWKNKLHLCIDRIISLFPSLFVYF